MDIVDRIFDMVDIKYREQRDFAKVIGVTPSIVSEWRRRKSASYQKRLAQIAEALGTTTEYLLTGKEATANVDGSNAHTGMSQTAMAVGHAFDLASPDIQNAVCKLLDIEISVPFNLSPPSV